MFRQVKWIFVLAVVPVVLGSVGCLNDASAPPLQGPSELGVSLEMRATPFLLVSDGMSSSVIECVVRGINGQRTPNVVILFDIRVVGSPTFRGYLDLGVLGPLNGPRPGPGGPEAIQAAATTGADGVARVRYWAPYRTDQENDIIIQIIGRPGTPGIDTDYRTAVARTVDIFLAGANTPSFPGTGNVCNFVIEPQQIVYAIGQQIFFTASVSNGPNGFTIARYEWDFGIRPGGTASGREANYVYPITGTFNVVLYTTESVSGSQTNCVRLVTVQ